VRRPRPIAHYRPSHSSPNHFPSVRRSLQLQISDDAGNSFTTTLRSCFGWCNGSTRTFLDTKWFDSEQGLHLLIHGDPTEPWTSRQVERLAHEQRTQSISPREDKGEDKEERERRCRIRRYHRAPTRQGIHSRRRLDTRYPLI
jgi:hypothetical protein